MPKIISECCELVKSCHINRSGPGFLRHSVVQSVHTKKCREKSRVPQSELSSSCELFAIYTPNNNLH